MWFYLFSLIVLFVTAAVLSGGIVRALSVIGAPVDLGKLAVIFIQVLIGVVTFPLGSIWVISTGSKHEIWQAVQICGFGAFCLSGFIVGVAIVFGIDANARARHLRKIIRNERRT